MTHQPQLPTSRRRREPRSGLPPATTVRPWGRRTGFSLPRHITSTAHLGALYPFSLQTGLGHDGVYLGTNRLTGGERFHWDLFTAYDNGLIQGPNAVISGAGAHGKSAIAKTYLYRATNLRTSGRPRFVAVIDPKGEWISLARALGWTTLQLEPGGTTRLNPLDVATTPTTPQPDITGLPPHDVPTDAALDFAVAQRASIAATLLAITLGRPELTATELRIITVAMRHLTIATHATERPAPTLRDLLTLLADPPASMAAALDTTPADLLTSRRLLLDACAILVEHDLRGMCDGATTLNLDWSQTPGLVVDLSALLVHRKALRLVLTAVYGWLASLMYSQPDKHKLNILDEAWIALEDLAIVRYLQDQWRLGRQWGCGNLLITHAMADLQSQTHDGSAQNKIAAGLLNTTSVRIFLHQQPENAHLLTDMGLNGTETALLEHLAPFQALWKIGPHTALIDHHIAPHEWHLANTDTAMRGNESSRVMGDAGLPLPSTLGLSGQN